MPNKPPAPRQGFTKLDNNMFPGHTRACRLVLIALSTHADSYIPTHQQLANQTGFGRQTVVRTIKKLEELGEIYRGEKGKNHTQKWLLNKTSVVPTGDSKLYQQATAKKTKEKLRQPHPKKPKPNAKITKPLPDWNCPSGQSFTNSDIVYWSKEIEPYFNTFINFWKLNAWVREISERHGEDAWKAVVRHFDDLRIEKGRPGYRWPFSYRNLQLLGKQVNFGTQLKII